MFVSHSLILLPQWVFFLWNLSLLVFDIYNRLKMTISMFLLSFIPCFTGKNIVYFRKKHNKRITREEKERRKDWEVKEDKGGRKERKKGKEKRKKKKESSSITIKIWMELNFSLLYRKKRKILYMTRRHSKAWSWILMSQYFLLENRTE